MLTPDELKNGLTASTSIGQGLHGEMIDGFERIAPR